MSQPVLLCTVGGSHQPILKAIRSTRPIHVCFFCTGKDAETRGPGSVTQVIGRGNVIKARPGDDRPTLPNIPAQAGLDPDRFQVEEVSADDLDEAFFTMRDVIEQLSGRFPTAPFVGDYTGGTKTMTAALVCTALECDRIELQLVTGARSTLEQVSDGTERAMTASVAGLRLDRAMAPHLAAWGRFAYREAADGLDRIRRIGVETPNGKQLVLASTLSHALASWDDFDHEGALERIEPFQGEVSRRWPQMLPALRLLTQTDREQHEAVRLLDLWSNAERRAHQAASGPLRRRRRSRLPPDRVVRPVAVEGSAWSRHRGLPDRPVARRLRRAARSRRKDQDRAATGVAGRAGTTPGARSCADVRYATGRPDASPASDT